MSKYREEVLYGGSGKPEGVGGSLTPSLLRQAPTGTETHWLVPSPSKDIPNVVPKGTPGIRSPLEFTEDMERSAALWGSL